MWRTHKPEFHLQEGGAGVKATLGGIVKHRKGGYGFKTTFCDPKTAQHYKDMFFWIITDDKIKTTKENGYYDKKE